MLISLKQAAGILDLDEDEVMFKVQGNDLNATINDDDMTWRFDIDEVIELREKLDEEVETMEESSEDD